MTHVVCSFNFQVWEFRYGFRYPLASAHDLDMIAGNKDASRRLFYLKRFELHETFHSWKAFGSGDGIVEYLG